MARLRAPGGCPWDREQSFDTIKPYLLEETYEVLDAIDRRDWRGLAEELGDLLLQPVFFAQMASEEDKFKIDDSLDAITEKLIRRHPHVFGDAEAKTAGDVKRRWDEIKKDEKRDRGEAPKGILESVPRILPALVEAQQIASKAAAVGFDWENSDQVLEKLDEELDELRRAARRRLASGHRKRNWRPALRPGEPRALRESGSRAGIAPHQCEVSKAIRARRESRHSARREHRRNGSTLAGGQGRR